MGQKVNRNRKIPPRKTAVIYARFSCSKQREASIEDQLRICTEWCMANGYIMVGQYCDRAASGRTDDRPEFQRMISNAGESEIVLVYMMDRFSRDIYDAPIYKKRLKDKGVRVVSATESMPDGPESMLMESIYEALAAMESAHIGQRTRRGMEGNALACKHNGVTLFGYDFGDDGRYVINDDQATIVREVFKRRISGETVNSIATDLAKRGYKTHHKNPCNYSMVNNMLHNEKYTGTYIWGETRVEGGMPAIVSKEEFAMARNVRSKKQRANEVWTDFALAGKGVCMECGMNLVGVSGRGNHNVKYDYYRCSKKCGCKAIRADWLENAIVDELRKMLSSKETTLEMAQNINAAVTDEDAESRLMEAEKSLADAQRGIDNVLKAVRDGMDFDDVREMLSSLKLQKAKAESDIALWSDRSQLDVEKFAEFLRKGATLDDKNLLRLFVWQVQLGTNLVVVVLNYDKQNEPARIQFTRRFEQKDLGSPRLKLFELGRKTRVGFVEGCMVISFPRAA